MANSIYPEYPPKLSLAQEAYLVFNINTWSLLNGLAVRPATIPPHGTHSSESVAVTAPVTLFPSLFPRNCFEQAKAIQKSYNTLYCSISVDETWLSTIVEE